MTLEAKPFNADKRGAVRETVTLGIPRSTGDDYFEWTIQKPGRIYGVGVEAIDPSKNGNLWLTQCQVGNALLPSPGKLGYTVFSWEKGVWVMPRDEIKIWVLSPIGIALRAALELDWFTD